MGPNEFAVKRDWSEAFQTGSKLLDNLAFEMLVTAYTHGPFAPKEYMSATTTD